jgi:hypothetical protein
VELAHRRAVIGDVLQDVAAEHHVESLAVERQCREVGLNVGSVRVDVCRDVFACPYRDARGEWRFRGEVEH